MTEVAVCTLATSNSLQDLKVFLFTLALFNSSKPKVYLLCDLEIATLVKTLYSGPLVIITGLDKYKTANATVSRKSLNQQKGTLYKTMWEDFMMEKATVMEHALKTEDSVFLFDSDICFLGPLPSTPQNKKIGVSPHMIKPIDEDRYGKFNAGYLWTSDKRVPAAWREASKSSRFFDQAALEDVIKMFTEDEIHLFSKQNNYGWWRMFQSTETSTALQKEWAIFRNTPGSGIRVDGSPLLSIHTHWSEQNDYVTYQFNVWVLGFLTRLGNHPPATSLYRYLTKEFPHLAQK
jgi:hypothetical protein